MSWGMARKRAAEVLRREGLEVVEREPTKTPSTYLSAKREGWDITVYFDDHDRLHQVTLLGSSLSEAEGQAARERLAARFGKEASERESITNTWKLTANGSRVASVRFMQRGWRFTDDRARGQAEGATGFADLNWGDKSLAVQEQLRGLGYSATTQPMDVDPCSLSNAPPACEPNAAVLVRFYRPNDEGRAVVHKKDGLSEISLLSSALPSEADARARLARVVAENGKPREIERSTKTTWRDGSTESTLSLQVRGSPPTRSAIENHSPMSSRRDDQP